MLLDILNGYLTEEVLLQDNITLVVLALCAANQLLNEGAYFLGSLESSGDALMNHQVCHEVPQHCLSVFWVAPELTDVLLVPHFIIINN